MNSSHWISKTIGGLIDDGVVSIQTGFPQGQFTRQGDTIHLRPFNVGEDGTLDLRQLKYVSPPPPESPYWVREGDVLFNNTNSEELVGKTAFVNAAGRFVLSNHMTVFRIEDTSAINAEWLANILFALWRRGQFQRICRRHVNQASIGVGRLRGINVALPPISEQRAIAHLLRTVQKARDARQRELTLERERKAALMEHLFTHGTRGETTKQTEIGEIPESWAVRPLNQIAGLFSGGTPSKSRPEWWKGSIPWVSTKDLKKPRLSDVTDHITEEAVQEGSRLVPANSLFVGIRGMILAKEIPVCLAMVPMAFNQDVKAVVPREGISPDFLLYAMSFFKSVLNHHVGTSAHGTKRIGGDAIATLGIPLPPAEEQKLIADALTACDEKLVALSQEQTLLSELFNALLEELMTRKVSVEGFLDGGQTHE